MDIYSWLFVVFCWDFDYIVDYGLFLEEYVFFKNNSFCKFLCCYSSLDVLVVIMEIIDLESKVSVCYLE